MRITIIGFVGKGNYGDDLMCAALTEFVGKRTGIKIRILTSSPQAQASLASADVEVCERSIANIYKSLADSDVLCQGGGTVFHDSYTGESLVKYWINLAMWAGLFWVARLCGLRVIMLGSGIGPLRHYVSRRLSKLALSATSVIVVRDRASVDTIQELCPRGRWKLGFDLAALILRPPLVTQRSLGTVKVLAISVCSLTEFLGDSDQNRAYWRNLAQAINYFHQEQPLRVLFLSLFDGDSSDRDVTIAEFMASHLATGIHKEHRIYSGNVQDFSKACADGDWFLCTKYHSAVTAYLLDREFAVITYNRKVADFAEEIGLPHVRRISANKPQTHEAWLGVLRSFRDCSSATLLDREEASQRTGRAVLSALTEYAA